MGYQAQYNNTLYIRDYIYKFDKKQEKQHTKTVPNWDGLDMSLYLI